MTRIQKVWLSVCLAAAGVCAVAIWTDARTTSVYAGAALEHARSLRDPDALFRGYAQEMATVRSTLWETTLCSIAIVGLLVIALALTWTADPARSEEPNKASETDAVDQDDLG